MKATENIHDVVLKSRVDSLIKEVRKIGTGLRIKDDLRNLQLPAKLFLDRMDEIKAQNLPYTNEDRVEVKYRFGNGEPLVKRFIDRKAVNEWMQTVGMSLEVIEVKELWEGSE